MAGSTNQATVQSMYESFGKGDIDGILAKLAEDVVWEGPDHAELPHSGTYRGKAEVKRFFAGVAQVEVSAFEPQEYINSGNSVAVIGRWAGNVRSTGKPFKSAWVMVWDFANGKARRFRAYEDTATMAAAFGK